MPRLTAGALSSRLVLQSREETTSLDGAIVVSWTTYATIPGRKRANGFAQLLESEQAAPPGRKRANGFAQLLESEQAAPRRAWEIDVRRPSTPFPLPTRVLHDDQTLFVLAAVDDEEFRDQTMLACVDGVNMAIGELATVHRRTPQRQADASYVDVWAEVATDMRLRMDDADASLVQRLFGEEHAAHVHATIEIESDVRLGDGLTITSGRHREQRFLVRGRTIDPRLPAQAYFALALERTTKAFS